MIRSIQKLLLAGVVMMLGAPLLAQKSKSKPASSVQEIKVPMTVDRWEFPAGSAEFIKHGDVPAMKLSGPRVVLKDLRFTDGTIEYDVEPQSDGFTGIGFRVADARELEYFYLRMSRAGNPAAMDAVQYAPVIKGVNLWDMLDHYQGPANMTKGVWNHVKLVVSGKQMLVYVNDLSRAVLQIPHLEGDTSTGSIAFDGKCIIAGLVVKPGVVEGLSNVEGIDPTYRDPRYIRTWQVTAPQPLPKGREVFDGEFPNGATEWKEIVAERLGLVNLTRLYGQSESRRYVWVRTKLVSASEQKKKINLGFSDEVWVYLNRQPVFVDKNIYFSPAMRKDPDGRISIANSQFDVTLTAGDNELLIGVANDFFGWGVIAQLDDMQGVEASVKFAPAVSLPKDLSMYLGNYKSTDPPLKIVMTTVDGKVMAQAEGQSAVEVEYFDKDKFRLASAGVVLEFYEGKMILKEGMSVVTLMKE